MKVKFRELNSFNVTLTMPSLAFINKLKISFTCLPDNKDDYRDNQHGKNYFTDNRSSTRSYLLFCYLWPFFQKEYMSHFMLWRYVFQCDIDSCIWSHDCNDIRAQAILAFNKLTKGSQAVVNYICFIHQCVYLYCCTKMSFSSRFLTALHVSLRSESHTA